MRHHLVAQEPQSLKDVSIEREDKNKNKRDYNYLFNGHLNTVRYTQTRRAMRTSNTHVDHL